MEVVRLVAYLGTPASELARIVGCEVEQLVAAEAGQQALTPGESARLGLWLSAAWWRHGWRVGLADAQTEQAVREAAGCAERLCWVPSDWTRDLAIAAACAKDK